MKGFARNMKEGDVMPGGQVARVIQSRHPQFPEGRFVIYCHSAVNILHFLSRKYC